MKYVILRVSDSDLSGKGPLEMEVPFIFPNLLVHAKVAEAMGELLLAYQQEGYQRVVSAVAAGEISSLELGDKDAYHGESESLGVKSRGADDAACIMCNDYLHGIL